MRILDYDLAEYDFPSALRAILGVDDLAALTAGGPGDPDASLYRNMEEAPHYRTLGAALADPARSASFAALYRRFVAERVAPEHPGPILYQARPTFRMLFPDTGGAARFHRDRDYGHDPAEVNYTVALTPAFASNAIWIESADGAADHAPIEMQPGQFARFDGANLSHGARRNETGAARVSFDFRVVAMDRAAGRTVSPPGWPLRPDPHRFAASDGTA